MKLGESPVSGTGFADRSIDRSIVSKGKIGVRFHRCQGPVVSHATLGIRTRPFLMKQFSVVKLDQVGGVLLPSFPQVQGPSLAAADEQKPLTTNLVRRKRGWRVGAAVFIGFAFSVPARSGKQHVPYVYFLPGIKKWVL